MPTRYFGLIPAAGSGARFGGGHPKQYTEIGGRTLLWLAVRALLADARIDTVFVVLAPGDTTYRRLDWSAFGDRIAPLYCGGATRAESVRSGLICASDAIDLEDWVLVHDAARPCLAKADLARLVDTVSADEVGGILAVPLADTLKRADAGERVAATEPREGLWRAQTPQMFRLGTLLRALDAARDVTDEAAAVEALGLRPKLVAGSAGNIKVTYPEDVAIAAALVEQGGHSGARQR